MPTGTRPQELQLDVHEATKTREHSPFITLLADNSVNCFAPLSLLQMPGGRSAGYARELGLWLAVWPRFMQLQDT